jgi:hypothetical protein
MMKVYILIDKHNVAKRAYIDAGHATLKIKHNPGKYSVITVPFEVEQVQTEEEWLAAPERKGRPWLSRRHGLGK